MELSSPRRLIDALAECGVSLYVGVPDSILKDVIAYAAAQSRESTSRVRHVVAANEGAAIALGAGHYLATHEVPVVYMQNSGLGNAVNPLTSLADPEVYGIPMLLLIGWRGEPGRKDEPQHLSLGGKTIGLLDTLQIPHAIIDSSTDFGTVARKAIMVARETSRPYALVVRAKTFKTYHVRSEDPRSYSLTRESALDLVLSAIGETAIVVSTTGKLSRELFEYRERLAQERDGDFFMLGAMGLASQLALGVAAAKPAKEVYCLDGDGAVIMHMGAMAIIGGTAPRNFRHIIFNNGAHDSVGGQATVGFKIDFGVIAAGCGYTHCCKAQTEGEIAGAMRTLGSEPGPTLLEIRVNKGARENLGRPSASPLEAKRRFMEFLRESGAVLM
jgi:phosphonopyruvate decarboxylase